MKDHPRSYLPLVLVNTQPLPLGYVLINITFGYDGLWVPGNLTCEYVQKNSKVKFTIKHSNNHPLFQTSNIHKINMYLRLVVNL